MAKKTKRRTAQSYLQSAKRLSSIAPSLRKYNRRRTNLSPQEKAAISRKENILKRANVSQAVLRPLTKRQAKILSQTDTPIITDKGFRMIALRNTPDNVKIKIIKGQLAFSIANVNFVHIPVEPDLSSMIDKGQELFDALPDRTVLHVWLKQGRSQKESRDMPLWIARLQELFTMGTSGALNLNAEPSEFVFGIVAQVPA